MVYETPSPQNFVLNSLIASAYTADTLFHRINLLRAFYEDSFFVKKNEKLSSDSLEKFCEERTVSREDCEALSAALTILPDTITPTALHDYFEKLSRDAEALPDFIMIVPVGFGKEMVQRISIWVREHVSPTALLTFKTERMTLGGCAYIWQGVRRDIALDYYLAKYRKDFDALLKTYDSANERNTGERP